MSDRFAFTFGKVEGAIDRNAGFHIKQDLATLQKESARLRISTYHKIHLLTVRSIFDSRAKNTRGRFELSYATQTSMASLVPKS